MNYQEKHFRMRHGWACEPTTIALVSIGLSAAATGASLVGQKQQADASADYQTELARANNEAARIQAEQVREQQAQSTESTARESQKAATAGQQARSTAAVSAGEAGVSGNSVEALLRDFRAQEAQWIELQLRQKQLADVSAGQQIESIRASAAAGNLSMNAPIGQPNYLAGALSFGAQAAGTYAAANPRASKTNSTGGAGTFSPAPKVAGNSASFG